MGTTFVLRSISFETTKSLGFRCLVIYVVLTKAHKKLLFNMVTYNWNKEKSLKIDSEE